MQICASPTNNHEHCPNARQFTAMGSHWDRHQLFTLLEAVYATPCFECLQRSPVPKKIHSPQQCFECSSTPSAEILGLQKARAWPPASTIHSFRPWAWQSSSPACHPSLTSTSPVPRRPPLCSRLGILVISGREPCLPSGDCSHEPTARYRNLLTLSPTGYFDWTYRSLRRQGFWCSFPQAQPLFAPAGKLRKQWLACRWKWVAEALLHSLSPVAWKILAFPRIVQSVSTTNAAELHSAAATCCTRGDPYVNGHVIYLAPAQTPEAVAPFSCYISLFRSTGFSPDFLTFLPSYSSKEAPIMQLFCCWFDRTVQEAFLDFHFLQMTWQYLNTLIRKGEIDAKRDFPIKTSSFSLIVSLIYYILEIRVDSPIKISSLYFLWSWAWNIYSARHVEVSNIWTVEILILFSECELILRSRPRVYFFSDRELEICLSRLEAHMPC